MRIDGIKHRRDAADGGGHHHEVGFADAGHITRNFGHEFSVERFSERRLTATNADHSLAKTP